MGYLEQNYRCEEGRYLIELEAQEVRQLYHTLDPSPFNAKDLDENAESYIVSSADDFPAETPFTLRIYLPEGELHLHAADELPGAISAFFAYRAQFAARQRARALRHGRTALLMGLCVLFVCMSIRVFLLHFSPSTWYLEMLAEVFLICGWVAMWHPAQVHLYDWWPIRRRERLYRKLAQTPVELKARR